MFITMYCKHAAMQKDSLTVSSDYSRDDESKE